MPRLLTTLTLTAAALAALAPAPAVVLADATPPQLTVAVSDAGAYAICGTRLVAGKGAVGLTLDEPATVTAREVAPFGLVTTRAQSLPAGATASARFARFPMLPGAYPLPGRYTITYTAKNAAGLTSSTRMRFTIRYPWYASCGGSGFPFQGAIFSELPSQA